MVDEATVFAELDSFGVLCVIVRLDPFAVPALGSDEAQTLGDLIVMAARSAIAGDGE